MAQEGRTLGNYNARLRQLEAMREARAEQLGVAVEEVSADSVEEKLIEAEAALVAEEPVNELKCDECGFVAKNKIGMLSHERKHKGDEDE